ncbi:MAG: DUF2298 domain-containing protein [Anaerolineales bacterium]|jgi:YYY domain-containing protein
MAELTNTQPEKKPRPNYHWLYDLGLVFLLLVGAYFRLVGLDWDADQNLHPDERFLTGVETALVPVDSLSDYWDTDTSTLNPHNQGYGFFVYGTLPIFTVRYVAEWTGNAGWGDINLVGRQLSALVDLLVVAVVYFAGTHLYGRKVGLLGAAFSTFTVLQIQLSHYFAVDTFLTLFTFLSVFFAIRVATDEGKPGGPPLKISNFVCFGIVLGMAVASKVTTVPVALTLPVAVLVRFSRLKQEERYEQAWLALGYLSMAAFISILTFRIFQPYAFSGPGFFGMLPNEKWLENLRSLRAQQVGDVDWPPSIQWARRPLWFSWQNMVTWGMGLPMGLLAWAGFAWVGFRMLRSKWQRHFVLWAWTAGYFIWQSSVFNPTMRYEIPIYPPLAIFAAWAVFALWDSSKKLVETRPWLGKVMRPASVILGVAALGGTILWAASFIQIYTRPVTRIAASDWIYQNVPGPLTLSIESGDGIYHQPLSYPYNLEIRPDSPFTTSFTAKAGGTLSEIALKYANTPEETRHISLVVIDLDSPENPLMSTSSVVDFGVDPTNRLQEVTLTSNPPVLFTPEINYALQIDVGLDEEEVFLQDINLNILSPDGEETHPLPTDQDVAACETPFEKVFTLPDMATLTDISLSVTIQEPEGRPVHQTLQLTFSDTPDYSTELAKSKVTLDLTHGSSEGGRFALDRPVQLEADRVYYLRVSMETEGGVLTLLGSAILVEAPWDDGLPLRTGGYDGYGGIYQSDLNLNLYADDNPEKLDDFLDLLEISEYFAISSSRQWASTTRIPERYPLNVTFYRHLLGCPPEMTIEYCYNVADVDTFSGDLGFDLVQVYQSDPNLGSFKINDQFAEEAFTVYDHPKVFIFQKRADYDHENTTAILTAVDLDTVIHLTPKEAGKYKSLLLPSDRLEEQRAGGTWSEIFDVDALINRSQFVAVVVWYLAVAVLGLAMVPILRRVLPGLSDKGYPLARTAGMLLLAYFCWIAGSARIPFDKPLIWAVYGFILLLGLWQAYRQREELKEEWRKKWKYFLSVEILFLSFFLLSLLVRYYNPDLWHPFKGGEKPMDFSYLNAVLKSTSFPPYDPWYADGYINYYYYGFVFVGVLVKMLGIDPAVAYNLIIPTLFATFSIGAFSIGWNLVRAGKDEAARSSWWVGISAALGAGILGNLGTLRMIFRGFQQLGAMGAYDVEAGFLTKWSWAIQGIIENLFGNALPFSYGDWYWLPSRAIAAVPGEPEPITEFPWFTFIYADLHAHMIALPITVLALGWLLSVALGKTWINKASLWQAGAILLFGALTIGALRPTNTWDLPTYLTLGVVAATYVILRYFKPPRWRWLDVTDENLVKWLLAIVVSVFLIVLAYKVLYLPYDTWYDQPYTDIQHWAGGKTHTQDYLTHWGLFLFVITSWLLWETRQWMANTPLSHLRKLVPHRPFLQVLAIAFLIVYIGLFFLGVRIHWLALPLAVWAAVLLMKPGLSEPKRVVLFLIGTCLFLTMMVEVIVLAGDVGRMNTVFKFYLQVWVMFAVCSAAALGWIVQEMKFWSMNWRAVWQAVLMLLVGTAALFTVTGTAGKLKDRMNTDTPPTLDGTAFMPTSEYIDEGGPIPLGEDLEAIQWLQQNVEGSPVIVEGPAPLYHWSSRMTIYTGLPGVLGWDWHQIQQRGFVTTSQIGERRDAIIKFFNTVDVSFVEDFLAKYDVSYIILGTLERNFYPGPGLEKFDTLEGVLWREVYQEGGNTIYQVIPEALRSD